MNQSKNSTRKIAIPKTADHFHKWGGTDNQKVTSRKLLINSDVDGLSRTIRTSYYKAGFANYIHNDGRAANAVLIIKKL